MFSAQGRVITGIKLTAITGYHTFVALYNTVIFCRQPYVGPTKNEANVFFVFCHYPSFHSHHCSLWLLPVISLLITNTETLVRACLSIWFERFRESQIEDERGPLCILFLYAMGCIVYSIWFPLFMFRCHSTDSLPPAKHRRQWEICLAGSGSYAG